MAEKRPVKITETILRDAHQSLIATRMPTELMLPIAPTGRLITVLIFSPHLKIQ